MAAARHKFGPGDRVSFLPGKRDMNVTRGVYTILRILPQNSDGLQYRVKNVLDGHERVLDEAQISGVDHLSR